jgi:hypothetical protein
MPSAEPSSGNRVAIVTGASSGVGREVALLLARRGYHLLLMARRKQKLEELAAEISRHAGSTVMTCDLCQCDAIENMAPGLGVKGPVEVLINNAGHGLYQPFLKHSTEDFRRLMEVHYFAPVSAIRAVLPAMVERGRGHVINIASISVKMGPWGHAGYAAAKSALATLTQSLAAEYAGTGVRFSYVNPGIVDTDYFRDPSYAPLLPRVRRHAVSAQYAAKKIVSLLDRPRLELCIPAHYRLMDFFKALSPTLAHLLVARQSRPDGGKAR